MMPAPNPRPTNEDRIRAALWFAQRGFGIFPVWSTRSDGTCRCPAGGSCDSPGKHPVGPHGFKEATTDPARIRTFLSAASEPNYGLVPPEGVCIWDIDSDEERERLARLAERHGPMPATLRDTTAHGEHVFWRWPDGLPRPLKRMFGLVTRWGSGSQAGYVIGPRSVHASGVEYRSAPGAAADIATLPEAWARAAIAGEGTIRIGGQRDPADVAVGGRHDYLRDTARLYAGTVRDPDALFAAVWAANAKLSEPKTADEVRRAIGDVLERFPADPVEADPETGELRRAGTDEVGLLPPATAGAFPAAPDEVAYRGLLGECVLALADGTDASLVGMLGSLIAFCGALVPGRAYFHRTQTSSPFIALVGESSIGRKGTAMMRAFDAVSRALERVYVNRAILDGLNSGEGLVSTLHYKQTAFPYEPTVGLVFEEEYASLLASRGREGSTLDAKMRAAFDGGPLSNRKARDTQVVTPPYWLPALIAITPVELRQRLEPGALRSGSANRWLYLPVVRRDALPTNTEPVLPAAQREALRTARQRALDGGGQELAVEALVVARLAEYADFLPQVSAGLGQDLCRRLSVIAFRVALVHALVERSGTVTTEHLERALGLTEYARRGIPWVFGQTIGNRDAELLLRHLQQSGALRVRAIAREIIRDPIRRMDAIDELARLGYAEVVAVEPGARGGRPGSELRLRPGQVDFVGFGGFGTVVSQVMSSVAERERPANRPTVPRDATTQESVTKPPDHAQDGVPKPVTNRDERAQGPVTEPVTNRDKTSSESLVIDHSTGEVMDATGEWARPCRDYLAHRSGHRNTAAGWDCDACYPEGQA